MNQRTSPRIRRRESPPVMRGRAGYRKAEPYLRKDFSFRCAYCGEYHIATLRLNRSWLQQHRRNRTQKWIRFNEAHQLQVELERAVEAQPPDEAAQMMQRLLSFLSQEIAALQSELAVAIPMWQSKENV